MVSVVVAFAFWSLFSLPIAHGLRLSNAFHSSRRFSAVCSQLRGSVSGKHAETVAADPLFDSLRESLRFRRFGSLVLRENSRLVSAEKVLSTERSSPLALRQIVLKTVCTAHRRSSASPSVVERRIDDIHDIKLPAHTALELELQYLTNAQTKRFSSLSAAVAAVKHALRETAFKKALLTLRCSEMDILHGRIGSESVSVSSFAEIAKAQRKIANAQKTVSHTQPHNASLQFNCVLEYKLRAPLESGALPLIALHNIHTDYFAKKSSPSLSQTNTHTTQHSLTQSNENTTNDGASISVHDHFLRILNVTHVTPSQAIVCKTDMQGKFKQIKHFVEILISLVRKSSFRSHMVTKVTKVLLNTDLQENMQGSAIQHVQNYTAEEGFGAEIMSGENNDDNNNKPVNENEFDNQTESEKDVLQVQVLDLCCGKGYLTFAAHHALSASMPHANITTIGLDVQPSIVRSLQATQKELCLLPMQSHFEKMQFSQHDLSRQSPSFDGFFGRNSSLKKPLRIVLGLHACDTLTDDVLHSALQCESDIIVVSPCCHKQVRRQLRSSLPSQRSVFFENVQRSGVLQEKLSEMITDAVRASVLRDAGYEANIVEFVQSDATLKNTLICAVKRENMHSKTNTIDENAFTEANQMLQEFGVNEHRLLQLMGSHFADNRKLPSFLSKIVQSKRNR